MSHNAAHKPKDVKPYEETIEPSWNEDQGSWNSTGPSSWQKQVICPRCGHGFTAEYNLIFKSIFPGRNTPKPERIDIGCTCATTHPPRDKGDGCGWYGFLIFSP